MNESFEPLVSVIMPCFNASRSIRESLYSVLHQNYRNLELIVCDDYSEDESCEIVKEVGKEDERVIIVRNTGSRGAANARNKALSLSKGRYIAFLDADDIWYPDKLEKQIDFMCVNDCAFSYSDYEVGILGSSKVNGYVSAPKKVTYKGMKYGNFVGCLTAVYDVEKLGKVEQPDLPARNDWALWIKILEKVCQGRAISIPLARYSVSKTGLSSNKYRAFTCHVRIMREIYQSGRVETFFCLTIQMIITLNKKLFPRLYNLTISRFF